MGKYLDKFKSTIPAVQGRQIFQLLNGMKDAGNIRSVNEYNQKLQELSEHLRGTSPQPLSKFFTAFVGNLIDSDRFNAMVKAIGFDYSQKHKIDLKYARKIAQSLRVPFKIVKVDLGQIGGSSLTGGRGSVVVPGRNAIFLSLAAGYAQKEQLRDIFFGANRDDYENFPDCREIFVYFLKKALYWGYGIQDIKVPFLHLSKKEIVAIGKELKVPYELTWSCYFPKGSKPCGKCEACLKRYEALASY